MYLINFFLSYFLLLLASSVVITAFFCVSRGYTETLPDGSTRRYGKILKGYYFFWFRETGKKQVRYLDDQLAALVHEFATYYKESLVLKGDRLTKGPINSFEAPDSFMDIMPLLRNKHDIKFKIEQQSGPLIVSVYKEDATYFFPEWVRTVMAGCITCTPTVYGNLLYWGIIVFFKHSVLYSSLFYCFNNEQAGVIIVWLTYWVSLAWLNTVLWNIYDK